MLYLLLQLADHFRGLDQAHLCLQAETVQAVVVLVLSYHNAFPHILQAAQIGVWDEISRHFVASAYIFQRIDYFLAGVQALILIHSVIF